MIKVCRSSKWRLLLNKNLPQKFSYRLLWSEDGACGFHLKSLCAVYSSDLCVVHHGAHMEDILQRQTALKTQAQNLYFGDIKVPILPPLGPLSFTLDFSGAAWHG